MTKRAKKATKKKKAGKKKGPRLCSECGKYPESDRGRPCEGCLAYAEHLA